MTSDTKTLPYIDGTVYPDQEPPQDFENDFDRADYLHRISTAFDFGIVPEAKTLRLLFQWKHVFDQFPVLESVGYHAMRCLFGWDELNYKPLLRKPHYLTLDAKEGRTDPCEDMI